MVIKHMRDNKLCYTNIYDFIGGDNNMDSRKQKALLSVRVTNKFKKQLEDIADSKGITLPDLVRFILTSYIEENKEN